MWHEPMSSIESGAEAAEIAGEIRATMTGVPFTSSDFAPLHPLYMQHNQFIEMGHASASLISLVGRAARERAESPSALVKLLRERPRDHPLLTDGPDEFAWSTCIARPDAVYSGGRLQFIECNIGGSVGGAPETHRLAEVYREIYGAQEVPSEACDPFPARAALFRAACDEVGAPYRAAIVGTVREQAECGDRYHRTEVRYLRNRGWDAHFFEPEQLLEGLRQPDGSLRYPVILKHLVAAEWLRRGLSLEPILEAARMGALLLTPHYAALLSNKTILAWLSEDPAWLTEDESEFVRRYVPWTRVLNSGDAEFEGVHWRLTDLVSEHRERFVLKRANGTEGRATWIGAQACPDEWKLRVLQAAETEQFIVQEWRPPDETTVTAWAGVGGAGGVSRFTVRPVLGPFVMGGVAAGCCVRLGLGNSDGVISRNQGATLAIAAPGI